MSPLTLAVIAFVLALLLFGFAFWTPIYAVPLVLLLLVGVGIAGYARRNGTSRGVRDLRAQANRGGPARETEFTDRDRESLYER